MSKTKTIEMVNDRHAQKIMLRVLISTLIVLSVTYVYLIGSITFNVLARKSLEATSKDLTNKVGSLELTYLASTNKIDRTYATELGFVDAKNSIFATRANTEVAIR